MVERAEEDLQVEDEHSFLLSLVKEKFSIWLALQSSNFVLVQTRVSCV